MMDKKYIFALIVIIIVLCLYNGTNILTNQYDDAYITYRYAVNLAEGNGFVFNKGEKIDAASSFLYTIILAGFYVIGITNLEIVSILISFASLFIIVVIIINITNSFTGSIIAFLTCIHGFISGWAVSGMETIFFTMIVSLFIYCLLADKKYIGLLIFLVILARHDGLLLLPVYLFIKRKYWKEYIWVILGLAGYYIFRFSYYDNIIPHVIHIKSSIIYYQSNPNEMLNYWMFYVSAVLFGLTLAVFSHSKKHCYMKKYSILLYGYCIVSLIIYAFGIRADMVRYSVHLLPVMIILFLYFLEYNKRFIYIFIIIFSLNSYMSVNKYRLFMLDYQTTQEARKYIGQYINDNILINEPVISGDLGMIAYIAINHRFIDAIGLTSNFNATNAKYIADTVGKNENSYYYTRISGNHKILKLYEVDRKNYAIALFEKEN